MICTLTGLLVGKSHHTLHIHDDNSLDMVFIDGDHSYEGRVPHAVLFTSRTVFCVL